MKRCQGPRAGGVEVSGTGSLSSPESGPGSSGACTSGITGSTGFGFAADFAALRTGGGSGLASDPLSTDWQSGDGRGRLERWQSDAD